MRESTNRKREAVGNSFKEHIERERERERERR
jgi:hypothetical protein